MTIVDQLTPVYYTLNSMKVRKAGSDVVATFNLEILNVDGQVLRLHGPSTVLTQQEKQVLAAWITREKAAFEAATGLTEWVEPEEE